MAFSEATIQYNFAQAMRQADELDDLANQLTRLAENNVRNVMSNVQHNWEGESASIFLSKAEKSRNDIMQTARQMRNVASGIRKAARNVRAAEEQARQIALTLSNSLR